MTTLPRMDITIAKHDLERALGPLEEAVDKKSYLPALTDFYFRTGPTGVTVEGTDNTILMRATVAGEVHEQGAVLVDPDILSRVRCMPEGSVRLTTQPNTMLRLASAVTSRRFDLATMSADTWPQKLLDGLRRPDGATEVTMAAARLRHLLHAVKHAVGTDETKVAMTCTYLRFGAGTVEAVATNGHVFAKIAREMEGATPRSFMLSRRHGRALAKLLDAAMAGGQTDVGVTVTDAVLVVKVGDTELVAGQVQEKFVEYEPLLASLKWSTLLTIQKDRMVQAMNAIQIAAGRDGVKFVLKPGEDMIRLTATSPEAGDAEDFLPVDSAKNRPSVEVTTKLNAQLVKQAAESVEGAEVVFSLAPYKDGCAVTAVAEMGSTPMASRQFTYIAPMAM